MDQAAIVTLIKRGAELADASAWSDSEEVFCGAVEATTGVAGLEVLELSARIGWGRALGQLGRNDGAALANAERAVDLSLQTPDVPSLRVVALLRLGAVLRDHGRVPEAVGAQRQALEFAEPSQRPALLLEIGRTLDRERDAAGAQRAYREALDMAAPGSREAAHAHQRVGAALIADGDEVAGRPHVEEALRAFRSVGARAEAARALAVLGRDDEALAELAGTEGAEMTRFTLLYRRARRAESGGDLDRAVADYREALALVGRAVSNGRVLCLAALGRVSRRLGDADGAIDYLEDAIEAAERLRAGEQGDVAQRALFGELQDPYQELIEALYERGRNEDLDRSFVIHELSRARGLADQLQMRQNTGIAAGRQTGEERALRAQLADPAADRKAVERKLELLRLRRAGTSARARVDPVHASEVQETLDDATMALAYDATGDATFVWLIRRAGAGVWRLDASGDEIASLVDVAVGGYQREEPTGAPAAAARETLAELLLAPVPDEAWEGIERLLIVPDGRLHGMPFELLPRGGFLGDRYTIAYAPSLTTMRVIGDLPRPDGYGAQLVAFGDPAYAQETDAVAPTRFRAAGLPLARLTHSGDEVRAIAHAFGAPVANDAPPAEWARHGVFLRAFATEHNVFREAPAARFVHFATHTVIDDDDPLYAGLALAPPLPAELEDDPYLDDLLQAQEFLGIGLSADVVVCSACKTGHGRLHEGEGLMGLSRALLLAGARCVIVSLWPVDDAATADLMQAFYRHMRGGVETAEALRRARAEIRGGVEGWRDPRDWAAFIAIGDAW